MKKRRLVVLLALVLTLPMIIIAFSSCSVWGADDFSSYDYFAVTDPLGKEYVYAASDATFASAAEAFATAKEGERPAWFADATPFLLEWIRDGKAHQFRLYAMPSLLSAYLEDVEGNGAYPTQKGIAFFLSAPALATALIGEAPPAVFLGGEEVSFSVCSWRYRGELDGVPFAVDSNDYLNQSAEVYPADINGFSLSFAATPADEKYTVYRGEDEVMSVASAELDASLATLAEGEYQLVAVLTWERENVRIRAGYSFSLIVP